MSTQCCCQYGASVRGEYPEFGCPDCPRHGGGMGEGPDDRCKRHKRQAALKEAENV